MGTAEEWLMVETQVVVLHLANGKQHAIGDMNDYIGHVVFATFDEL